MCFGCMDSSGAGMLIGTGLEHRDAKMQAGLPAALAGRALAKTSSRVVQICVIQCGAAAGMP